MVPLFEPHFRVNEQKSDNLQTESDFQKVQLFWNSVQRLPTKKSRSERKWIFAHLHVKCSRQEVAGDVLPC